MLFELDCTVSSILCDYWLRNDNSKLARHFSISSAYQVLEIFQKGIKTLVTITKKITYKLRYEKYTF